jgi:hypothetical protein
MMLAGENRFANKIMREGTGINDGSAAAEPELG